MAARPSVGVRHLDGRRKLPAREPLFVVAALKRSPLRVRSGPDGPKVGLPLYPRKRTPGGHRAMSEKCQEETFRVVDLGYSITSSARASNRDGMSRPRALAVTRLTASSNFTGACTGRAPGFSPLNIWST